MVGDGEKSPPPKKIKKIIDFVFVLCGQHLNVCTNITCAKRNSLFVSDIYFHLQFIGWAAGDHWVISATTEFNDMEKDMSQRGEPGPMMVHLSSLLLLAFTFQFTGRLFAMRQSTPPKNDDGQLCIDFYWQ